MEDGAPPAAAWFWAATEFCAATRATLRAAGRAGPGRDHGRAHRPPPTARRWADRTYDARTPLGLAALGKQEVWVSGTLSAKTDLSKTGMLTAAMQRSGLTDLAASLEPGTGELLRRAPGLQIGEPEYLVGHLMNAVKRMPCSVQ